VKEGTIDGLEGKASKYGKEINVIKQTSKKKKQKTNSEAEKSTFTCNE